MDDRRRYTISPITLRYRVLDRDVDLDNKIYSLKRKVSTRVVLTVIMAIIVGMLLLFKTSIGKGGLLWTGSFIISYVWLIYISCFRTPTDDFKYTYLWVIGKYFSKSNRYVSTRNTSKIYPIEKLLNLEDQDFSDGYIHFKDGDIGELIEVTGMASRLMFLEDQDVVLYDTVNFYRGLETQWVLIFDTLVSPQRVETQLDYIRTQKANLNPIFRDTGVETLLDRKEEKLGTVVGKSYESIRQYMILKTTSIDEISRFENRLNDTVINTTYLKDARRVDDSKELYNYFLGVFGSNG
ncbi:hypothetical protein [Ligilactobacillus faecis]|uniref:hypothetical protein n=1 Tax=Ligilactobacillus faecis TaxID=762833 RepID=UPI003516B2F7